MDKIETKTLKLISDGYSQKNKHISSMMPNLKDIYDTVEIYYIKISFDKKLLFLRRLCKNNSF
jgi:hypothetical protein